MTQTSEANFAEYTFHRHIHSLVSDELGKAVLRIHNERFKGTSIADLRNYQPNEPIAFSDTPRILSYSQILHQLTNGRIQVASPRDVVRYWNDIPERDATFADTDSIALFSNEGDNQDLAQVVCGILGIESFEVPLLVAGLGVKKADNSHRFTFTRTDLTRAIEAPYLKQNCRVRYDETKKDLVIARDGEEGVQIWTPKSQSGLRRAYRGRGDNLYCGDGRLLLSSADGRVQVVQKDPKGRAEKVEQ